MALLTSPNCYMLRFVLHAVNLYLESSEAETVEQSDGDQTAQDAIDRRDETRSS